MRAVVAIERIAADLARLGVVAGDTLMVHASLRAIGPVEGGADGVIDALEAVLAGGTLLMVLGAADDGTPFDASTTPADPEVGVLAETLRRRPGVRVTDHPEGRFAALGADSALLLADSPWHDYFGLGSPLHRLVSEGGRVLRMGADDNTTTLLHHAEYLVPLIAKRRVRRERVIMTPRGPERRIVTALDNSEGIVDWPGEDYFASILRAFRETGLARRGLVGGAASELCDAGELVAFGVNWMAARFERPTEVR